MSNATQYWLWVIALAAVLFLPVSRLIHVFSVRRLQRKLERHLEQSEIDGQKNRAYVISTVICFIFSLLFNYRILP